MAAGGERGRAASEHEAVLKEFQETLDDILGSNAGPSIVEGSRGVPSLVEKGLLPDMATLLKGDANLATKLAACPEPRLASLGLQALDPKGTSPHALGFST